MRGDTSFWHSDDGKSIDRNVAGIPDGDAFAVFVGAIDYGRVPLCLDDYRT